MFLFAMTAATQEGLWLALIALISAIALYIRGESTRREAKGATAKADYLLNGGGDKKIDDRLVAHSLIETPPPCDPEPEEVEEVTEIGALRSDIQQLVNYWKAKEEREAAAKGEQP